MTNQPLIRGRVEIGPGCQIQENVTLGHLDDGLLVIGANSIIRSGSIVYSGVRIGNGFKTGHNVLIREETTIGDNVLVGTNSVIDGHCQIGDNVSIQTNVYVTAYTELEDNVFMGPCSVTANDKYMEIGARLAGPVIRKGARIGANAVILPGVIIGEGAVIGSGAVVTHNIPAGMTAIGNPAAELVKSQHKRR